MTTPSGFELRETTLDHPDGAALVAEVQEYYTAIYGSPDSAPADSREFAPPHGRFLLGYLDGAPVAMGGWRFHTAPVDIDAVRPAEIKRMYVVKAARGRGLARSLLARLEQSARAEGADALILETGYRQPDAIALYRTSGYADVPPFGHYAGVQGSVHLAKTL